MDAIKYLRLFDAYEDVCAEYDEMERERDILRKSLEEATDLIGVILDEISIEEAERVLAEHPEIRGYL